jgi:hydroxymethylpyrimidine/phosphomethylpyrimidine kinase
MLCSSEIIKTVAEEVCRHKIPLVVDPVMYAEAGGTLLREEAVPTLIDELLPLARVITPNVYEASVLSNIEIKEREDAEKAAVRISELGADAVIITGGHLEGVDILYDGQFKFISGEFINKCAHGTGCSYSAAITAGLAMGYSLYHAAVIANEFVRDAIIQSKNVGSGDAIVDQISKLRMDSDRYRVLENVKDAVEMIGRCEYFQNLIPEVGSNIAMAIHDAGDKDDVAAVQGRIMKGSRDRRILFGASDHVARMILTAMRFDKQMRCAINVRYSPNILHACEKAGMKIAYFDRRGEPAGKRTMEWGVAKAINSFRSSRGEIPDVIYDEGCVGKEAMIRIFGRDATGVADRTLSIAEEIEKFK